MKCEFCNTELNHLALREVFLDDEELLFVIECINPYCNKKNIVSQECYLNIRKDILNLTQTVPYVKNKKLPNEMNVIFVSMERCGISWIIRVLSEIHDLMFGVPIDFHTEISHVVASRKKFSLPQGWSNVYNVDPQRLIERGYDKIIIVQRKHDELIEVHTLYEEIHEREERMRETFERHYELVYGKEYDHPNCLKVHLEELNSYTVAIFKEILDFLNFPESGRPIIVPVKPPDRNWETYSSILKKGREVNVRLQKIDALYNVLKKKKDYE